MGARAVDSIHAATSALPPGASSQRATDASCRAIDIVGSLILLVLLAPLMLVVAAAIRLETGGPILFRQRRVGRSLAPFTVNKFRTMRDGVSHDVHRAFVLNLIAGEGPRAPDGTPLFKLREDDRVTRVGRILRKTSLDELPQLYNVLRGEMSLVGPRPPIPYEVDHYPPHWLARFAVKPGLTGLWQVKGRSNVPLEEMIALDVEYVRRRSFWLNVWILLRTVPAVLSTRGAG